MSQVYYSYIISAPSTRRLPWHTSFKVCRDRLSKPASGKGLYVCRVNRHNKLYLVWNTVIIFTVKINYGLAYTSDKESSVAAFCAVAESPALQEHHPVGRVTVSTYEETSLSEVVAQSVGVVGSHPAHLLSRSIDLQTWENQRSSYRRCKPRWEQPYGCTWPSLHDSLQSRYQISS